MPRTAEELRTRLLDQVRDEEMQAIATLEQFGWRLRIAEIAVSYDTDDGNSYLTGQLSKSFRKQ